MLSTTFLPAQHVDWQRHLAHLNAHLRVAGGRDRAAMLARVEKGAEWLAHHARLLRRVERPGQNVGKNPCFL